MGAAAGASFRSMTNWADKKNASAFGLQDAYAYKYGQGTAVGSTLEKNVARQNQINANIAEAGKNTDLTGEIIKSVARAELARKKTGMTRDSTFVADRPSPSQMDAERKKNPALNQYTHKPKPPGAP
jgi:hypothetical protein